jgi:protoporphyrinogen oxidase
MVGCVSENPQRPVLILGAGLTGLSTALHLRGRPFVLVERDQRVGGKARSERHRGYTFDVTGHWLHLRDPRVQALVDRLFEPGDLLEIERRTGVYTHGVMLPYPFQANLYGLPLEVVSECLVGFVRAQLEEARGRPEPRTFAEFAEARFGAGIARHFFVPYNTKLWGMSPDELTPDWVSRFIPLPDLEQVISGAIGLRQEGLGYNVRFRYPKRGGIDAVPEAMHRALGDAGTLRLGTAVEEIDPVGCRVKLQADPDWTHYGALVSTLPLPVLVERMRGVPPEVRAAAKRLRWVSWRWLDVATRSPVPIDEHWVYVPEPSLPFFRVGVYSNALPAMAPEGKGALYVELADRCAEPDLPAIYGALARMGALASADDVEFSLQRDIEHAYVVFDDAYGPSRRTIFEWLDRVDVRSCGRYGAWVYNSMEDSILQGMEAAAWASR